MWAADGVDGGEAEGVFCVLPSFTLRTTSLVSLSSLQKINNILSRKSLSCSRPLWIHYLGEMMAIKVKLTFYPTLVYLWITAMPSIKALGAA